VAFRCWLCGAAKRLASSWARLQSVSPLLRRGMPGIACQWMPSLSQCDWTEAAKRANGSAAVALFE
jgi:hypothetical protein